jgi:hypothetical protein
VPSKGAMELAKGKSTTPSRISRRFNGAKLAHLTLSGASGAGAIVMARPDRFSGCDGKTAYPAPRHKHYQPVIIRREMRASDQIIESKQGGTDQQQRKPKIWVYRAMLLER